MNRAKAYLNRFVKRKQQQIEDIYHTSNLKEIKPITSKLMEHSETIVINNSKRQMLKETRDSQIQRQNKLLLQKISSVMTKKGNYSVNKTKSYRTKVNKSLNEIFRKKQMDNIQEENKKFLSRLQNKKPTLNVEKLNKEWLDNKSTMKRMANYQFYLTNLNIHSSRMQSSYIDKMAHQKYDKLKVSKFRNINGHRMLIKIEFTDEFLKIVGDSQDKKDLKVIQIPKEEGIEFIQKDCQGKIDLLLQKLRYDDATETLYLLGQESEKESSEFNPEIMMNEKQQKEIPHERINKSVVVQTSVIKQITQEEKIHQTISHRSKSIQKQVISEKKDSKKNEHIEKEEPHRKQIEDKEEKKIITNDVIQKHSENKSKSLKSEEKVKSLKSEEKVKEIPEQKKQVVEAQQNQVYEQQFQESGNIETKDKQNPINNL